MFRAFYEQYFGSIVWFMIAWWYHKIIQKSWYGEKKTIPTEKNKQTLNDMNNLFTEPICALSRSNIDVYNFCWMWNGS